MFLAAALRETSIPKGRKTRPVEKGQKMAFGLILICSAIQYFSLRAPREIRRTLVALYPTKTYPMPVHRLAPDVISID
jgi:hypothetical protein